MRNILYAKDIEKSVKKNKITQWQPFSCSICNAKYGYYFIDDKVFFDGTCDCGGSIFGEKLSSYQEIATLYNINSNKDFKQGILDYFKIGD